MRKLFVMCTMALFALVACEKGGESKTPTRATPVLTPTSEQFLNYDLFGGEGEITFTLENPNQTDAIKVKSDSDWVTISEQLEGRILFDVAFNDTSAERTAVVTVSYGARNFSIVVIQASGYKPTTEFKASYLNGAYYGPVDGSDFNYFIVLSDTGVPASNNVYSNSVLYRLDLYSETFGGFGISSLAEGVYNYDGGSTGVAGSFSDEYSIYMVVDAGDNIHKVRIIGGSIKVTDGEIVAVLRLQNGEVHRVTYTGSLELNYDGALEPPFSTLMRDLSFAHSGGNVGIQAYYHGDRFRLGLDNWMILMTESKTPYEGDFVCISVLTPTSDMDIKSVFGEYTVWSEDKESYDGTFIPGFYSEGFGQYSYYTTCVNGQITLQPFAPIANGTVKVEKQGNGMSVSLDCVDDNGNTIKGSYISSSVDVYDFR